MALAIILIGVVILICINSMVKAAEEEKYKELEGSVLKELGFANWNIINKYDECVSLKSRQSLMNYDSVKFFKENKEKLEEAEKIIKRKNEVAATLRKFLEDNQYKSNSQYFRLVNKINEIISDADAYRILVKYVSPAGKKSLQGHVSLHENDIAKFKNDPTLLMSKTEYNKLLKEQQKEAVSQKHHEYYEKVNKLIDYANENRDKLIIKGGQERLDTLIVQLFAGTVNSIKKIKSIDSEEWDFIGDYITSIKDELEKVVNKNLRILEYYGSADFLKIKETCETLMSSQREFNEYIGEKVQSISKLFGTRVVRNATVNNDGYEYIRPYKKTITPFTAEVSAAVFSSAENNSIEYIVKYFYPNKALYPEQIQKLQVLLEELETLKEAKQIIDNYKAEYQQYLGDVPRFIMEEDEAGFYSKLGFANIDESVLAVEYKFSYTSGGGMAQRSFTVPMTEETIVELITVLQSKLTAKAFAKEQRTLMTKKLREFIKNRDNFTCCSCSNSIYVEPNLLLEIDHIIPIAKGGLTVEENLQTLCWKCNRAKADKLI